MDTRRLAHFLSINTTVFPPPIKQCSKQVLSSYYWSESDGNPRLFLLLTHSIPSENKEVTLPTSPYSEKASCVTPKHNYTSWVPTVNTIQKQQKVPFKPPPPMLPQLYCLSQDSPNHRSYEQQTLKWPNSMWIHVWLLQLSERETDRQWLINGLLTEWNTGSFFVCLICLLNQGIRAHSHLPLCICFLCYQMPFSSTDLATYVKQKTQRWLPLMTSANATNKPNHECPSVWVSRLRTFS